MVIFDIIPRVSEKPLISFCIKSFNNERHVCKALEGAFAQTYRPLEVIVVDDASKDGSWETIQTFCREHPPDSSIRLVLKRNATNLGSLGNWEEVCSLASGELLVKADGDDISTPDRAERLAAAWVADGRRAMAICHSGWQIGENGERKGRLRQVTPGWPLGAAMAFSRMIPRFFGRTSDGSLVDDEVWVRRALMLGPVLTIPDRLVHYRLGSGQTTNEWNIRSVVVRCTEMSLAAVRAVREDAERLEPSDRAVWLERLAADEARLSAKSRLVNGRSLGARWQAFREMRMSRVISVANYLRTSFLLPRPFSDVALFAYVLMRNILRRLGVI